jgi:hypothetical protein
LAEAGGLERLVGDKPVLDMKAEVNRRRNFAIISHPGTTSSQAHAVGSSEGCWEAFCGTGLQV